LLALQPLFLIKNKIMKIEQAENLTKPPIFLDGNGNELKKGDKVIMTLYGLGSGEMDIVENEGELCLYDEKQGCYPLKHAVKREDMFLERLFKMDDN
jgi:hypothetical protein